MKRLLFAVTLASGCAAVKPPQGILVIKVSPPDARVTLDEHYIGSGLQLSGHRLRINAGHRRLEISAEGHYAQRRDAEVPPNGETTLEVQLHEVPDGVRGD
jgi:hypothetical protein